MYIKNNIIYIIQTYMYIYITSNMISIYYISLMYMKYKITKGDTGKRTLCNIYIYILKNQI